MGTQWMPSARRDSRAWTKNPMSRNTGSLRVIVHTTENSPGTDPKSVADYMWNNVSSSTGYHVMIDPTGKYTPVQLRPFDVAAGSLYNSGATSVSPNKQGTIEITVSMVDYAKNNAFLTYGGGPYWQEFLDCVASWGVPLTWIGPLPPGGGGLGPMDMGLWESGQSGWCAHATVPKTHNKNSHWDPGRIDTAILFAGRGGAAPPPPQEWDGNAAFHRNLLRKDPMMRGEDVKWVQAKIAKNPDGIFGDDTKAGVVGWQQMHALAADGVVGPATAASMDMPGAGGAPTPAPPPPATGTLGPFPLPGGHWFGEVSSNSKNHSGTGQASNSPDRNNIRRVQGRVGVSQDGLYGPNTAGAVRSFQSGHGLAADSLCGVTTWSAM